MQDNHKTKLKVSLKVVMSSTRVSPEPPTLQDKLVHSYLKSDGQQTWLGSTPKGVWKNAKIAILEHT